MAIYYVKIIGEEDEEGRQQLLQGLRSLYGLDLYEVMAVDVPDCHERVVGSLLGDLAEHVAGNRLSPVLMDASIITGDGAVQVVDVGSWMPEGSTEESAPPKQAKRTMPKELCPECGQTAQMTKKGYCKLCAMRKAREAKNGRSSTTLRSDEEPTVSAQSAVPVVREREAQGAEIVFEMTPTQQRNLVRHGAIKGKKLG